MAKPDGGPAFPQSLCQDETGRIWSGYEKHHDDVGMSLRDYFAAHAPAEPQSWFQPAIPERPKSVWHEGHETGDCYDCSPENWKEQDTWDQERKKQRLIQWPYAWADAMLAERDK